jgi:hypothetical protein
MCLFQAHSFQVFGLFIFSNVLGTISTTIESRKFRIPSDLRRQPGYRPVSSKVGDHLRILLGVVVYLLFTFWPEKTRPCGDSHQERLPCTSVTFICLQGVLCDHGQSELNIACPS